MAKCRKNAYLHGESLYFQEKLGGDGQLVLEKGNEYPLTVSVLKGGDGISTIKIDVISGGKKYEIISGKVHTSEVAFALEVFDSLE